MRLPPEKPAKQVSIKVVALMVAAVASLVPVAAYVAFELGKENRSHEFAADLAEYCRQTIGQMPSKIPQRLVLDVSDEWNRSLTGGIEAAVRSSLAEALLVFDFSERVVPSFVADEVQSEAGDHVARLVIELGRRLELMGVPGRQCSNLVIVSYTASLEIFALVLIHELGHFFGLYHEWQTYMGHPLCPETHERRFSERQFEILDRWNRPGTTFVPHWTQMETDGKKDFDCPLLSWTTSAAIVAFLAIVGIVAFLWGRRKSGPQQNREERGNK